MIQPIRAAIEGKFTSFDNLAKALEDQNPELEWPAYRSLGVKIGVLDRGIATWWQKRPQHAAALARLLEVDLADLGLHPEIGKLFHFAEFPELPPVDPSRETFCCLGEPVSSLNHDIGEFHIWFGTELTSIRREPVDISWLHVPSGTGYKVLLAELEGSRRFDVMEVRSFSDALPRLKKAEPLVIGVQDDGGFGDLRWLLQRPENAGLLIIAPFPAPVREVADALERYSWDFRTADEFERSMLVLTNPNGSRSGIQSYTWRLKHNWQGILLEWIEARLLKHEVDTTFSAKGLVNWLDKFDPHREWIRSPEDLMALCRVSHKIRETRLPRYSDSKAGEKLLKAVMETKPYLQSPFTRLSIDRWNALSHSWRAALPYEVWRSVNSGTSTRIDKADLVAIADAPNQKARRELANRVAEQIASTNIQLMLDDQLLVKNSRDNYELKPRLLADLVVRDYLMEQLVKAPLDVWALACFDPTRRQAIDAVLDALSFDKLLSIASHLPDTPNWEPAETGAAEALFYAIGRRILSDTNVPESVIALGPRLLSRMDLDPDFENLKPWSRATSTQDEYLEWMAVCWAWSLTERPDISATGDYLNYLFPGWCQGHFQAHYLLPDLSCKELREICPNSWRALLRAADGIFAKHETKILQVSSFQFPAFMHSSLLAASAAGVRPAEKDWWKGVLGDYWAEERLLVQLANYGASAAGRLWPSLLRHQATRTKVIEELAALHSRVRIWILQQLSVEEILSPLTFDETLYLADEALSMPPCVRTALIESLPLSALDGQFERARRLFRSCCTDSCLILVRWLETDVGFVAAEIIWEQEPDVALKWICDNFEAKKDAVEKLICSCPRDYAGNVAQLLLDNPSLLDVEQRREWAKPLLRSAGASVQKLFAVMRA